MVGKENRGQLGFAVFVPFNWGLSQILGELFVTSSAECGARNGVLFIFLKLGMHPFNWVIPHCGATAKSFFDYPIIITQLCAQNGRPSRVNGVHQAHCRLNQS